MELLYPLTFIPVYKDYLWGGTRIPKLFQRSLPDGVYAESWEISDHPDGMSIVQNGPLKGTFLSDLVRNSPKALFGNRTYPFFPLLLKVIDASQNLSIQVHPSVGNEAKTEAWMVLEAEPDAVIYAGFKESYSKKTIDAALGTKQILEMMQKIPVKKGDMIFIPGGRLHAIGKGCLILEIQQHSNTTYRVYDWDRTDATGKARPLHLDEARQVLLYNDTENPKRLPPSSSPFTIEKRSFCEDGKWLRERKHFEMIFCADGEGHLKWEEDSLHLKKGTSVLLPANLPSISAKIEKPLELFVFTVGL